MKLLTQEIISQFRKVWNQSESKDPIVVCKFFNPTGSGTWYATEFDEEEKIFFGYVSIFWDHNDEWGRFSLVELESFMGRFGLGIERDRHFETKKFSELGLNT